MNGPQDMGGAMGFGPVQPEVDEPPFHADWEKRAFALTLAMGATGQWNLDMSRFARETLPPAQYLGSSYYQIWFAGTEKLLLARELLNASELAEGRSIEPPVALARRLSADMVANALSKGAATRRPSDRPARFAVGDRVRTRLMNPLGHTRLPRYARGKAGCVIAAHGMHVFADAHAHGLGEQPQWLYTVRFDAAELWGPDTTADSVSVDCWESYLADTTVRE